MYKCIYIDDNIATYIKDIIFRKNHSRKDIELLLEKASLAFLSTLKSIKLEFLFSEDVLETIKRVQGINKRTELEAVWHAFQKGRVVKKNMKDFKKIQVFLRQRGIHDKEDAQHIANAMLAKNHIDIFLTYDKRLIQLSKEIQDKFEVKVIKPSQLAEYYKYIR